MLVDLTAFGYVAVTDASSALKDAASHRGGVFAPFPVCIG